MTTPETLPAATRVKVKPGTRLETLLALYAELKPAFDGLNAQLESVKDGIKTELQAAAPGVTNISADNGSGLALELAYVESWRLDAKRLKAEDAETYVQYAKKSGSWSLKQAKS